MSEYAKDILEKTQSGERVRIGKRQLRDVIWAAKHLGALEAKERHQVELLEILERSFRSWAEGRAAKKDFDDDLFARAYIEAEALASAFIDMVKRPGAKVEDEGFEAVRERVRKSEHDRLLEGGRRWAFLQRQLHDLLTAEELEFISLYRQSDEQRNSQILDCARVCADAIRAGQNSSPLALGEA
jgi:hypothetical protein